MENAFYRRNDANKNLQLIVDETEAQKAEYAGQIQEAMTLWSIMVSEYPYHIEPLLGRGRLLVRLGQLDAALADFDKGLLIKPYDKQFFFEKANVFERQGDNKRAIENFNNALNAAMMHEEIYWDKDFILGVYINYALVLHDMKAYNDALSCYMNAMTLNSENPKLRMNMGNLFVDMNLYSSAIHNYDVAINLKPDYYIAYYNRAMAHKDLNQIENAMEDYQRVLEINPTYYMAHLQLGNCYYTLGHYEQAIEEYTKTIYINPNFPDPYHNRGVMKRFLGLEDEANIDFQQAQHLLALSKQI